MTVFTEPNREPEEKDSHMRLRHKTSQGRR